MYVQLFCVFNLPVLAQVYCPVICNRQYMYLNCSSFCFCLFVYSCFCLFCLRPAPADLLRHELFSTFDKGMVSFDM